MQCFEYLAIQYYARSYCADWAEHYDELELAEVLDEREVHSFEDIIRIAACRV